MSSATIIIILYRRTSYTHDPKLWFSREGEKNTLVSRSELQTAHQTSDKITQFYRYAIQRTSLRILIIVGTRSMVFSINYFTTVSVSICLSVTRKAQSFLGSRSQHALWWWSRERTHLVAWTQKHACLACISHVVFSLPKAYKQLCILTLAADLRAWIMLRMCLLWVFTLRAIKNVLRLAYACRHNKQVVTF